MPARWLYVCAIAVAAAGVDAAEVTSSPAPTGSAAERGVVGLRCAMEEEGWYATSRGVVMETGGATADVVLTTAHGLPPDVAAVKRDCRAFVGGKQYAIADVLNAGGDREGGDHDWAVLVLMQRIAGDVHRWRAALPTRDWLRSCRTRRRRDPAYAPRRRRRTNGLPVLGAGTPDPSLLFAHSCIGHPGTSGSPFIVALRLRAQSHCCSAFTWARAPGGAARSSILYA